jgi:hypothetical protein
MSRQARTSVRSRVPIQALNPARRARIPVCGSCQARSVYRSPRPSVPRAPIDRARRSTRGQASRPPRFIVLRHGLILTNGSAAVPPWAPAMVLSLQRGKTPTYEKSMATRRPQSPRALPCDRSRRYDRA